MKNFYQLLAAGLMLAATSASAQTAPTGTYLVDRTGWQITAMNETPLGKEAAPSGPAAAAIDGNYNSFYHSDWSTGSGRTAPQAFMVDMGKEVTVAGFMYAPRMGNNNGNMNGYDFYVSNTPFDLAALPEANSGAASGNFENNLDEKSKVLDAPQTGRYVLLVLRSSHSAQGWFCCSEFNVLTNVRPNATNYTLRIVGNTAGSATVEGHTYNNGDTFSFGGTPTAADVVATAVDNYGTTFNFNNTTKEVTLTYHVTNLAAIDNTKTFYVGNVDAASRGTWLVKDGNNHLTTTKKENVAIDMNDAKQQFAFVKSDLGNYYLYSVSMNKFVIQNGTYTDLVDAPTQATQMIASGVAAAPWSIRINGQMLNCAVGYPEAGVVTNWNTADNGNRYFLIASATANLTAALEKVNAFEKQAYNELVAKANALKALTEPATLTEASLTALDAALAMPTANAEEFAAALTALTAAVNNAAPYIHEGYYTLSNSQYGDARFMEATAANAGHVRPQVVGAHQVWKITPAETAGKYTLQNAATLAYVQTNGSLVETPFEFFAGINTQGQITFGGESGNTFLHSQDNQQKLVGWNKTAAASQWTLAPFKAITIEVEGNNDGFATFSAPFAVTIPENVKAYVGTKNGEQIDLTPVTGIIPARTGVLLNVPAGSYTFEQTSEVNAIDNNLFVATLAPFAVAENALYTLQQPAGENVGFYPSAATVQSPYQAAVAASEAAGAAALLINKSTITGIHAAQTGAQAGQMFDLSGRRVTKAQKGIYIINGQKTIVQ